MSYCARVGPCIPHPRPLSIILFELTKFVSSRCRDNVAINRVMRGQYMKLSVRFGPSLPPRRRLMDAASFITGGVVSQPPGGAVRTDGSPLRPTCLYVPPPGHSYLHECVISVRSEVFGRARDSHDSLPMNGKPKNRDATVPVTVTVPQNKCEITVTVGFSV